MVKGFFLLSDPWFFLRVSSSWEYFFLPGNCFTVTVDTRWSTLFTVHYVNIVKDLYITVTISLCDFVEEGKPLALIINTSNYFLKGESGSAIYILSQFKFQILRIPKANVAVNLLVGSVVVKSRTHKYRLNGVYKRPRVEDVLFFVSQIMWHTSLLVAPNGVNSHYKYHLHTIICCHSLRKEWSLQ